MIDYRTFHESTWLADFLSWTKPEGKGPMGDMLDRAEKFIKGYPTKDGGSRTIIDRNLAKTASNLTAVFPVIVSRAIDIEKAVMVSKAIERKAVNMLQMLFAANQITGARSAKEYLNSFHHNIKGSLDLSSMNVDDVLKYTEFDSDDEANDYYNESAIIKEQCKQIYNHVAKNIHYVLETEIINPPISDIHVLNEYKLPGGKSRETSTFTYNAKKDKDNNVILKDGKPVMQQTGMTTSKQYDDFNARPIKDMSDFIKNQVLQSDIKKANEAQPTLMIVNFTVEKDHISIPQQCVIGVKALLHYVDPQDIVNRVILKQSDSRGLFNLIRATTGEIAFFRDFLFSLDRAKVDAVAKAGKGSTDRIWKLLELRADHLKGRRATRSGQADCSAITSLVISQAEVDHIKQFHRIDLNKAGTFTGILRGYNMMAGVIVDDVAEKVDFLWDDGTKMFESLSFMSLEREETGAMYKKVINLAMKGR